MADKKNQWIALIDMERKDLLDMAKKENKEIKEALEGYEILTGDAEVKRLAEIRNLSKLEENSALRAARMEGKAEIVLNMYNKKVKIKDIANFTNLSEEEVEKIIKNKSVQENK